MPRPGRETFVSARCHDLHALAIAAEMERDTAETSTERDRAAWSGALRELTGVLYTRTERPYDAEPIVFLLAHTLDRNHDVLVAAHGVESIDWSMWTGRTRTLTAALPESSAACVDDVRTWAMALGAALERATGRRLRILELDESTGQSWAALLERIEQRIVELDDVDVRTTWIEAAKRSLVLLDAGDERPRYRQRVRADGQMLLQLLDAVTVIQAALWLEDDARRVLLDRVTGAIEDFADPVRRDAARDVARSTAPAVSVLRMMNEHAARAPDMQRFIAALGNAVRDDAAINWTRLDRFLRGQRRFAAELREADDSIEATRLRIVDAELRKQCERRARRLRREHDWVTSRPGDDGDMVWLTLMAEFELLILDLEHVRQMPTWFREATLMNPAAAPTFRATFIAVAEDLTDVNRRDAGRRLIRTFLQQREDAYPMPFELRLQAPDAMSARMVGGRLRELADRINDRRAAWIEAWGDGRTTSPGGRDLAELRWLLRTLDQLADLSADGAVDRLIVWSGFDVEPQAIDILLRQIIGHTKLFVSAIVDDDHEAYERHRDAVERVRPLVAMLHELLMRSADLPDHDGIALHALGEIAFGVQDDAWHHDDRETIALIGRMLMESSAAAANGDQRLADVHSTWCADAAATLVHDGS